MSINTKVSVKVEGQKVTFKLKSTNRQNPKFEIKLDGWNKWKEVEKTYVIATAQPGERTVEARSYSRKGKPDPTPAVKHFTVEKVEVPPDSDPEPEPPSEINLPLITDTLGRISGWNSDVTDGPGQITNVTKDGKPAIRYYQGSNGERTELQVHRPEDGGVPSHGFEALYVGELLIPSGVKLNPEDGGWNTVWQLHGNNNAGYTGGLSVREEDEAIRFRVKGGKQLSTDGSHRYEFEDDRGDNALSNSPLIFGHIVRDHWHTIEYHALWTDKWEGFVRCRLDRGEWIGAYDVPTASNIADVQMFRHGWYPHKGVVYGPLELFTRNTKVYGQKV